ncbi:MAG: hypothetical protein OXU70_12510 [Gammaproteobacteria bacterium]|nr:hypothetical protein [Gammaproteobacteria bacterium]
MDDISPEALLFQTGYLTILEQKTVAGRTLYTLGYPNREVREGLNGSLLRHLVRGGTRQMANCLRLYRLLEAEDL